MTLSRPAWTLTEAVQRTGASRSTLRRYLDAGRFPNAYKDTSKVWRFPLEDLLAAGLSVSEPTPERAQNASNEQVPAAFAEQVSKLEQALREERARADNAERLAASYQANVQDLRRALRMLEAGGSKPEIVTEQAQNTLGEQPAAAPNGLTDSTVSKLEQPPNNAGLSGLRESRGDARAIPIWRRLLGRS